MYKFALVEVSYLKNEQYWFLLIEGVSSLLDYLKVSNKRIFEGYFKLKMKRETGTHMCSDEELAAYAALMNNPSETIVGDLQTITNALVKPKIDMVMKGLKLLVNSTNIGFCPFDPKYHKILEIAERDELISPIIMKSDIRITRWPNGAHYYLRIGAQDFGKFSTVEEAEDRAKLEFSKLAN